MDYVELCKRRHFVEVSLNESSWEPISEGWAGFVVMDRQVTADGHRLPGQRERELHQRGALRSAVETEIKEQPRIRAAPSSSESTRGAGPGELT